MTEITHTGASRSYTIRYEHGSVETYCLYWYSTDDPAVDLKRGSVALSGRVEEDPLTLEPDIKELVEEDDLRLNPV